MNLLSSDSYATHIISSLVPNAQPMTSTIVYISSATAIRKSSQDIFYDKHEIVFKIDYDL